MAAPMRAGYQRLLRKFVKLHVKIEANEKSRVPCLCAFYSSKNEVTVPKQNREITRKMSKVEKISTAMKLYLESTKAEEAILKAETEKYKLGKRHLAKIMGQDPATFGQDDINRAINYLLPSGLHDKKARPVMKHPIYVMPGRKVAEFGLDGRPYHYLFYTAKPNFFALLHTMAVKLENLIETDKEIHFKQVVPLPGIFQEFDTSTSEWKSKHTLSEMIQERISDQEYTQFINLGEALMDHVLSDKEKDFLMKYRNKVDIVKVKHHGKVNMLEDAEGRKFVVARGTKKTSSAKVRLYPDGTGKISINGGSILYFKDMPYREQILFPLQFTGALGSVDVVAEVEGGGLASQSLALRLAISKSLVSFVSEDMLLKMTVAGLLVRDPRTRERKKPGQKGARAKYTWRLR